MVVSTVIGLSIVAGIMACLLATLGLHFEKDKKKSRNYLIWFVLLIAASFAATEYAFFLEGYNLFQMIFSFNFPLIAYFGIWFAFVVWIFEKRKERVIWIIFLIALIAITIAAILCFNCIRF